MQMHQRTVVIPETFKTIVGIGTAVVAAVMAYSTAREGLDITEEKANDLFDKIKKRQHETPPPFVAE